MIVLDPRPQPSRLLALLSPVIAIALTLIAGGILMFLMGKPPVEALTIYFFQPFQEFWYWLTGPADEAAMWIYTPSEVIVKAIPLALIGAGLTVCFRANVWNIGAAGQYTMGAIVGGWLALSARAVSGWCHIWQLGRLAGWPGQLFRRGCESGSMRTRFWSA